MPINFSLLIKNVDTLNSIEINDKLNLICIENSEEKILTIEKPYFFRSIVRSFRYKNKEKLNLFIINLIQNLSIELSKFYLFSINKSKYSFDNINIKNFLEYDEYFEKFNKIKDSLLILQDTYKDDKEYLRKLKLNYNLVESNNPNYNSFSILENHS